MRRQFHHFLSLHCLLHFYERLVVSLLVFFAVAVAGGADFVSSTNNHAKEEMARVGRSALWERLIPSLDHRLDYLPDEFEDVVGPFRREDRDLTLRYRPLCETVTEIVNLSNTTHEYRPPYYHEVLCKGNEVPVRQRAQYTKNSQMCMYPGYSCIQRKREMLATRRRFDTNCWETVTMTVPSNCECMWPESRNGEIE